MDPFFLLPEIVESLHDSVVAQYGGTPGIKDCSLLMSALNRAENKFYCSDSALDIFDLAAAYAFGIARNHAFHDGNKRTAWGTCVMFLALNGVVSQASDYDRENKTVGIATGDISETEFAEWLRQNGCYENFWLSANDL